MAVKIISEATTNPYEVDVANQEDNDENDKKASRKRKKDGENKLSANKRVGTSLIAGSLAGACAKTFIAPLDRAKISFQVRKAPFSYVGLKEFLISDVKRHGFLNLWRGNSANMIRVMPSAAINFTSHEQYKILLSVDKESHSPLKRFAAGSLAGFTASSLTYPLDVARARMAVTNKTDFKNIIQICTEAYKNEGLITFYRGFSPSLIGAVPYAGCGYFVYETCKLYHRDLKKREPYSQERLVYGALAGAASQTLSYPLDIIRRRMQTYAVLNTSTETPRILELIEKIYREEGIIKGFYKGLSMNWIKGPIAAAIGFCTYDVLQKFLRE